MPSNPRKLIIEAKDLLELVLEDFVETSPNQTTNFLTGIYFQPGDGTRYFVGSAIVSSEVALDAGFKKNQGVVYAFIFGAASSPHFGFVQANNNYLTEDYIDRHLSFLGNNEWTKDAATVVAGYLYNREVCSLLLEKLDWNQTWRDQLIDLEKVRIPT